NLKDDRPTASIALPGGGSGPFVYSPDGKMLAIGRPDGSVRLVDLNDTTKVVTLPAPKAVVSDERSTSVVALRFAKGGAHLVVRHGVESVAPKFFTWDWQAGKQVDEPIPDGFGDSKISPDGRYELKRLPTGVELIDRTVRSAVVLRGNR